MFRFKPFLIRAAASLLLIPLLGSLFFTAASASTQSTTLLFPATADAFVTSAYPNANYGKALTLRARSSPVVHSYLRFAVTGLNGRPILQAHLIVFPLKSSSLGVRARAVADNSWGESTISYNNAPAIGTLLSTSSAVTAGQWLSLDVSAYVKSAGTYSFALTTPSGAPIPAYSREASANRPHLVLAVGTSTTSTPPAIKHVFIIAMENKSYSQVWSTSSTPYITQLGNTYARASNYHAITHPSLPNYLDIYAGSQYDISTDCSPSSSCHISARNLADNLDAKGLKWKGYMEAMPSPCYLTTSGDYAPKHDPFVYFDDIRTNSTRCKSHVVPFSAMPADFGSLSTTPNYAFISPSLCDDMHDCSISTGDNWLKNHVPAILSSAACTVDKCLLVVTWDEDNGSSGNHVLTIFAGSGAKLAATSSASYNHYSLLHTVEYIFGLPTQTSNDAGAAIMKDMLR